MIHFSSDFAENTGGEISFFRTGYSQPCAAARVWSKVWPSSMKSFFDASGQVAQKIISRRDAPEHDWLTTESSYPSLLILIGWGVPCHESHEESLGSQPMAMVQANHVAMESGT